MTRGLSPRIAVYTGTFDPVHLGHLDATATRRACDQLGHQTANPCPARWGGPCLEGEAPAEPDTRLGGSLALHSSADQRALSGGRGSRRA